MIYLNLLIRCTSDHLMGFNPPISNEFKLSKYEITEVILRVLNFTGTALMKTKQMLVSASATCTTLLLGI